MKTINGLRRSRRGRARLVSAEAEQGSDVAHLVEFRIVLDVEQLDVAADRHGNDGIANIFEFTSGFAADRADRNHVSIHVTAIGALDGASCVVLA